MEREVETLEKARGKQRPRSPQVPRQTIDFDRLNQGMNSLRDKVQADRTKQKETRQRTPETRELELDRNERNDRDGIDI